MDMLDTIVAILVVIIIIAALLNPLPPYRDDRDCSSQDAKQRSTRQSDDQ